MAKKKSIKIVPSVKPIPNPGNFLRNTGLLFCMNQRYFHPLGLEMKFEVDTLTILDHRLNPTQVFSPEEFEYGDQLFNRYIREHGRATMARRKDLLGVITQTTHTIP